MRRALIIAAVVMAAAIFGAPANGATDLVLCDGQTYSGWTDKSPIKLGSKAVHNDPNVRKVIRNCTFRDAVTDKPAIVIVSARNVLITGSTFDNIRTGQVGNGVNAVALKGAALADGITIENSRFANIAADGVLMADGGPLVSNVVIRGNVATAPTLFAGGSTFLDVKGAQGPILIDGNRASGFRPCTTECKSGQGAAIVVHESPAGRPAHVTITGNTLTDNTRGLTLNGADDVTATGNTFTDNLDWHLLVAGGMGPCVVAPNTYQGTGGVQPGTCTGTASAPSPSPTPTPPPPSPTPTVAPVPWWCRWLPSLC